MDTSHPFVPSKLNALLCASCYRPAIEHSTNENKPECQSCSNKGILTNSNGIWLCQSCLDKELETPISIPVVEKRQTPEEFIASKIQYIDKVTSQDREPTILQNAAIDALGSQSIQSNEDFFNARTKAISDRWAEIVADDSISVTGVGDTFSKTEQLTKEVREHYLHLKNVLFEKNREVLQASSEQRADQVYLNQLASKIREEIRVKLHLANIDYSPPIPKSAPKAVRLNKDDKIAADYAKIMGIPIETARRLITNKLKEVTGAECTCSSTPGICKIHSK